MQQSSIRAIVAISGTSMDGIDASIVETDGGMAVEPEAGGTSPYPDGLRKRLLERIAEPARAQSEPLEDLDRFRHAAVASGGDPHRAA